LRAEAPPRRLDVCTLLGQRTLSARPNFLFIVTDQCRYDLLGCLGRFPVQTPNLDRLAAEGVRFDRCYSVHPTCMPTRATWLTGLPPRVHGTRCNGIPLDTRLPLITDALRQAGYYTHGIGKIHLSPYIPQAGYDPDTLRPEQWPESGPAWHSGRLKRLPLPYYGFEDVDFLGGNGFAGWGDYFDWLAEREPRGRELLGPPPGVEMDFDKAVEVTWPSRLPAELHATSWAVECAEKALRRATVAGKPFFLWLSVSDPHPPYTAPAPWCDMYDPGQMPEPTRRDGELELLPPHYRRLFEVGAKTAGRILRTDIPQDAHRRVAAMMCGMVSQMDNMVGRALKLLDTLGLTQNTVVAFTSDHGQMLGDHWMYSMPPTHLDGVIRVPSVWRLPGIFRAGLVSPALVSHMDLAPTVLDLAGVPIPEGRVPPEPEAPMQRPPWPGRSLVALLTGRAERVQDSVTVENDADYLGLRMRSLITESHHITIYAGETYGELFDLRGDPNQLHNLWDEPGAQRTKRDLMIQLMYRFAETDSALPRRLGHA